MLDKKYKLLICSANMGNAEPNLESIHAWLPKDGAIDEVVQQRQQDNDDQEPNGSDRCVKFDSRLHASQPSQEYFDMIVIGMQEATFEQKTKENGKDVDSSKKGGFSSPEKILVENVVVKGAEKVGKEVLNTVQQLAGSKDHTKKKLKLPSDWVGGTKVLHDLIAKRLPSYTWHVAFQRGQMRMIVLTHQDSIPVKVESVKAENTGLASVAANKGGIVASITVGGGTRLAFVSAHLEAHEGTTHYQGRCSNLAEILHGTSTTNTSGGFLYDATLTNHYCFVSGDLNFRTITSLLKDVKDKDNINATVQEMIDEKQWHELNDADELHYALKNKDCLVGFETLPCEFPPTFKVDREPGFQYKASRTPSYTDRIVWNCAHQLSNRVKPLTYEPIEAFTTSDHKPIRGAFEITLNPEIKRVSEGHHSLRRKSMRNLFAPTPDRVKDDSLHLFFNELKCTNLKSWISANTKPDPYITFVSIPKELVRQELTKWQKFKHKLRISSRVKKKEKSGVVQRTSRGWTRTSRKLNCSDPDWSGEEIHLIMKNPKTDEEQDLTGALLLITVHDQKSVLDDNVIGTFALNLAQLYLTSKEHSDALRASANSIGSSQESRRSGLFRRSSMFFGGARAHDSATSAAAHHGDDMTTIEIDEPLVKDGKEQGRIRCSIDTWWFNDLTHARPQALARDVRGRQRSFNRRAALR